MSRRPLSGTTAQSRCLSTSKIASATAYAPNWTSNANEPNPNWSGPRPASPKLEHERRRLARGGVDGSIPGDLAREEQERIATELEQAQKILTTAETIFSRIENTLNRALALLGRCDEVDRLGGPQVRRFANQCFFTKLFIARLDDIPAVTSATLREPWTTLYAEDFQRRMIHNTTNPNHDLLGRGSKMRPLVPPAGLEPAA
jgi:hypothetical protein